MNRPARMNHALALFLELAPGERRVLLEVLRRVVAGVPLEAALELVTGERDVPAPWLKS